MATVLTMSAPTLLGDMYNSSYIRMSIPLANSGTAKASRVFITALSLSGNAPRISPKGLPLYLGDLEAGNIGSISGTFNRVGIADGQQVTINVQGTYVSDTGATQSFTTSRAVTIPGASTLTKLNYPLTHVDVAIATNFWTYTIFGIPSSTPINEAVIGFSLQIVAPVQVIATPPGWNFETDSSTFILWFITDPNFATSKAVRQNTSLTGFKIQSATTSSESTPYILSTFDGNISFRSQTDYVLTPRRA